MSGIICYNIFDVMFVGSLNSIVVTFDRTHLFWYVKCRNSLCFLDLPVLRMDLVISDGLPYKHNFEFTTHKPSFGIFVDVFMFSLHIFGIVTNTIEKKNMVKSNVRILSVFNRKKVSRTQNAITKYSPNAITLK